MQFEDFAKRFNNTISQCLKPDINNILDAVPALKLHKYYSLNTDLNAKICNIAFFVNTSLSFELRNEYQNSWDTLQKSKYFQLLNSVLCLLLTFSSKETYHPNINSPFNTEIVTIQRKGKRGSNKTKMTKFRCAGI